MTTPTEPMTPLTADRALSLLDEVVREFGPDHVYVNRAGQVAGTVLADTSVGPVLVACNYVHPDADGKPQPGCIVAHVLHRAGVPVVELGRFEGCSVEMFAEDCGYADADATQALVVAQSAQDRGHSWGDALHRARVQVGEPATVGRG